MAKIKATDLAYAAGLVDGEGSIGIAITRREPLPVHQLTLGISMVDREVLEWLHQQFGGSFLKRSKSKIAGRRQQWRWQVCGFQAVAVLNQLLPYLQVKRQQAELALQFGPTIQRGKYTLTPETAAKREELRIAISSLNYGPLNKAA